MQFWNTIGLSNKNITQKRHVSWLLLFITVISCPKGIFIIRYIYNPFLLLQQKRLWEVKNVQHLDLLLYSTVLKTKPLAYISDCFQRWVTYWTWQIGKITRIGFIFLQLLYHAHFMETDTKNSSLTEVLPVCFLSKIIPGKTTTS